MDKFNSVHAKALYLRFAAIYDHKFVKSYHDDDFKSLWENEWCCGLEAVNINTIKDALDYCRKNLEWPPSISEFIKICESYDGVPSLSDCIKSAVRREFNHPLALMCFQKVGTWAITHDTEKVLHNKFKTAYSECLIKFRSAQERNWALLEDYNKQHEALPPPSSAKEKKPYITLKQRLAEFQQAVEDAKLACSGEPYTIFPDNHINPKHRDFDPVGYAAYRDYLLSIPEHKTVILPTEYIYDRSYFINMQAQPAWLASVGYKPTAAGTDKQQQQRSYSKPKAYKNWADDE